MEKRKINFSDNDTRKQKISLSQKARYKRLNHQYAQKMVNESESISLNESLENSFAEISGKIANNFLQLLDMAVMRARIKSEIIDRLIEDTDEKEANALPIGSRKIKITPEQKERIFYED